MSSPASGQSRDYDNSKSEKHATWDTRKDAYDAYQMARLVALVAKSLSTGLSASNKKIDVFILPSSRTISLIDGLPVLAHVAFLVAVVAERKSSNLVYITQSLVSQHPLSHSNDAKLDSFLPPCSCFLCLTAYQTD